MKRQVKKTLDIMLLVFFVMAVTAASVNASQAQTGQKFMKTDFSVHPISGHGATRSYTKDCGTTRPSIHSECPYSNVHFWQRICAKLRGQRGVKLNLTAPNR